MKWMAGVTAEKIGCFLEGRRREVGAFPLFAEGGGWELAMVGLFLRGHLFMDGGDD